jgi:hypothetical protein
LAQNTTLTNLDFSWNKEGDEGVILDLKILLYWKIILEMKGQYISSKHIYNRTEL